MRARYLSFSIAVPLVALFVASGSARGEDISMPSQVAVGGRPLVLNGTGMRKATFLKVDVYVAGLYLPARSNDAAAIVRSPEPKMMLLHFVRGVDRADIVKAWREGFEKNAGPALPSLRSRIDQLDGMMSDIKKGQEMSFSYVPGAGTTVAIDRVSRGTIPGDDFAQALFAIWLGAQPPNEGLKEGLLGRK